MRRRDVPQKQGLPFPDALFFARETRARYRRQGRTVVQHFGTSAARCCCWPDEVPSLKSIKILASYERVPSRKTAYVRNQENLHEGKENEEGEFDRDDALMVASARVGTRGSRPPRGRRGQHATSSACSRGKTPGRGTARPSAVRGVSKPLTSRSFSSNAQRPTSRGSAAQL